MRAPMLLADLPTNTPRWTDPTGSIWAEVQDDHLVVIEHAGRPVPIADPWPRNEITQRFGQLTPVTPCRVCGEPARPGSYLCEGDYYDEGNSAYTDRHFQLIEAADEAAEQQAKVTG